MACPAANAEPLPVALWPTFTAVRNAILRKRSFTQKVKDLKNPCIAIGATHKTKQLKYYETVIGTDIDYAKHLLVNNELVAIPTETVYGLAANAYNAAAVGKIFIAKDRPFSNPLIVHVGNLDQLREIVKEIPPAALLLLNKFSPGPLTLLLPRNSRIPDIITAGLPDVAVRIPAHPLTLSLLQQIDFPLAAPSANPFGYISPTKAGHVKRMLDGKIPYILDGGECQAGIESTIVGFVDNVPIIYRQGVITKEDIEECLGVAYLNESKKTVAPGMLDSHYSPHTPLYLTDDIELAIKEIGGTDVGLVTYNEFCNLLPADRQILLFKANDFKTGATNLYAALHEMDNRSYKAIIVRKLPQYGIGAAVNDRLWRASKK
jgi:L-threonylcarbamoyladenylate synthase